MEGEPGSAAAGVGPESRHDLDRVAAWLARRDVASLTPRALDPVDVLVLCGSAVLGAVDVAVARVVAQGGAEVRRRVPDAT